MSSRAIFLALTLLLPGVISANKYEVPEAHIDILHPKGFRVCIPDEDGIQLFAFHGSINKELPDLQAGDYSADVIKKTNGVWCFIDTNKTLKFGDIINYWTYVQYDRLGYRRDGQQHTVTSFVDTKTPIGSYLTTPTTTSPSFFPSLPTLPLFPTINSNVDGKCGLLLNSLNDNVNQLHVQINQLMETNAQILKALRVLDMKNSGKSLVVTGINSDQRDPQAIITDIVTFKLNIPISEYTVKTIERLDDGSIMLELKTEAEMNHILSKWLSNQDKHANVKIEESQSKKHEQQNTSRENEENPEFALDVRRGN